MTNIGASLNSSQPPFNPPQPAQSLEIPNPNNQKTLSERSQDSNFLRLPTEIIVQIFFYVGNISKHSLICRTITSIITTDFTAMAFLKGYGETWKISEEIFKKILSGQSVTPRILLTEWHKTQLTYLENARVCSTIKYNDPSCPEFSWDGTRFATHFTEQTAILCRIIQKPSREYRNLDYTALHERLINKLQTEDISELFKGLHTAIAKNDLMITFSILDRLAKEDKNLPDKMDLNAPVLRALRALHEGRALHEILDTLNKSHYPEVVLVVVDKLFDLALQLPRDETLYDTRSDPYRDLQEYVPKSAIFKHFSKIFLKNGLPQKALEAAGEISNREAKMEAFNSISVHWAKNGEMIKIWKLINEVDEYGKYKLLESVSLVCVRTRQITNAWDALNKLPEKNDYMSVSRKSSALETIAGWLLDHDREEEAIDFASAMSEERSKFDILGQITRALAHKDKISEALKCARQILDPEEKNEALSWILRTLVVEKDQKAEAQKLAKEFELDIDMQSYLSAIILANEGNIGEATTVAKGISKNKIRYWALSDIFVTLVKKGHTVNQAMKALGEDPVIAMLDDPLRQKDWKDDEEDYCGANRFVERIIKILTESGGFFFEQALEFENRISEKNGDTLDILDLYLAELLLLIARASVKRGDMLYALNVAEMIGKEEEEHYILHIDFIAKALIEMAKSGKKIEAIGFANRIEDEFFRSYTLKKIEKIDRKNAKRSHSQLLMSDGGAVYSADLAQHQ